MTALILLWLKSEELSVTETPSFVIHWAAQFYYSGFKKSCLGDKDNPLKGHLFFTSRWDGINSALVPWMTPRYALKSQPRTRYPAVPLYGLAGVIRAGGIKATGVTK
jgi:hypothetical protein